MNNAPRSDSGGTNGGPSCRRWWALVLALAVGLVLGFLLGLAKATFSNPRLSMGPTHLLTTGRVEGPPGVALAELRVEASRHGRSLAQTRPDDEGNFRMDLRGDGPFDLHVTDWKAWRDPHASNPPRPAPTSAVEGTVRGLAWGARSVVLRVARGPLAAVSILVRGPDGVPASAEMVYLRSMTDGVMEQTGGDGIARFTDLPVRSWRVVASIHGGGPSALAMGWRDFVPQGQVLELGVPVGIRVFVRLGVLVSGKVRLGFDVSHPIRKRQVVPWRPGSDGRMAIFVAPDCRSLSLDATKITQIDERTTEEWTFAAGAMAVAEDAEVVLEPLER